MKGVLGVVLAVASTAVIIGASQYFVFKNDIDQERISLAEEKKVLEEEVGQLLSIRDFESWKSYSSPELGLTFKYPEAWGEAKTFSEDYSKKELGNPYFAGHYYSICFSDGDFCVVGYSKDYKVYESAGDSYYTGSGKILDDDEEPLTVDSEEIYFRKKALVSGQKTTSKTSFSYLSEASGVSVSTTTFIDGRASYPGISISTCYQSLSDQLSKTYEDHGYSSAELINEAKDEIGGLMSDGSKYQSQYDLYRLWLSTFTQS